MKYREKLLGITSNGDDRVLPLVHTIHKIFKGMVAGECYKLYEEVSPLLTFPPGGIAEKEIVYEDKIFQQFRRLKKVAETFRVKLCAYFVSS